MVYFIHVNAWLCLPDRAEFHLVRACNRIRVGGVQGCALAPRTSCETGAPSLRHLRSRLQVDSTEDMEMEWDELVWQLLGSLSEYNPSFIQHECAQPSPLMYGSTGRAFVRMRRRA